MKLLIRGLTALMSAGLIAAPAFGQETDFGCQFLGYNKVEQRLCYLEQEVFNLSKKVEELQHKTSTY